MHRIDYVMTAEDQVEFNLYYSSISPNHARQRRISQVIVPIVYVVMALVLLFIRSYAASFAFIGVAVAWFVLAPRYFGWRYRRYCERQVDEVAAETLPRAVMMELEPDGIVSASDQGNAKFTYDAVDRIEKLENYTYVFIGKGTALILPHDRVEHQAIEDFVTELEARLHEG